MDDEATQARKTRVIAIGNQKGGVGKTTNTAHISAALGKLGRKVLVWDLDVNHGLTSHFGIPQGAFSGTLHILTGEREPQDVIITHDEPDIALPENVHVIPTGRELETLDAVLREGDPFYTPHEVLRAPIEKLRGLYDYIFLDTAPNTNVSTTIASYIASDYFIISTVPERFALEGLKTALKDIAMAQGRGRNPSLQLLGVLVSGLDKRIRKAREYDEAIRQSFASTGQDSRKFKATVTRFAAIPRAQDSGKTVFQTEPDHEVCTQFLEIAREIEERIAAIENQSETTAPLKEVGNG
jgi:chromosome partitioning protein